MTAVRAKNNLPDLEKYEVLEEIGHGGMATVYRARDRRLGREVAVKLIHRHLRENKEIRTRFTDEARAVAKLEHDGIVQIHDVSDDDEEERYLVAELVRGKSLRTILEERGRMPAEVAAIVGIDLARALAHAHEQGIVHRDVKPENVLFGISEEGPIRVKITDFGIAKLLDQQGVTATGQVLGSPAYMSQEQIEGGQVDGRSDVFSLGVLLYECMCGHLPFEGKNPAQVLRRVLDGTFAPAERENPEVGAQFSQILSRMLAQDRDARFSTMGHVADALSKELSALGLVPPYEDLTGWVRGGDAFQPALVSKVFPKLFARGCEAEKRGEVVFAAACFNRALALRPGDADVLVHLTRMSRGNARRVWMKRALTATLALSAGAVVVFGLRKRATHTTPPVPVPSAPDSVEAPPKSSAPPRSSIQHVPVPVTVATIAPRTFPTTTAPVFGKERLVRFSVTPKSALISVDGGAPMDAFGQEVKLLPGHHTVVGSVSADNPCCSRQEMGFEVKDDGSGTPQVVALSLPMRPASLTSDGPGLLMVRCPQLGVSMSAKGTAPVPMSKLEAFDTCTLLDGGTVIGSKTITLRAGKATTMVWSEGR